MSLRMYLLVLLIGSCTALLAWGVVLVSINPFTAGFFGFFAFYLTLFFALVGVCAMAGTLVRARGVQSHDDAGLLRILLRSLRQAVLVSAAFCVGLYALAQGVFTPLAFGGGLLVLAALEFTLLFLEERHVYRVFRGGASSSS